MPFTHTKFGYVYGFGNLDTLFYFGFPSYIILRFNHCSYLKRLKYSSIFIIGYTGFKFLYAEDFRNNSLYFVNSILF